MQEVTGSSPVSPTIQNDKMGYANFSVTHFLIADWYNTKLIFCCPDAICHPQMIPLTLPNHSEKPWQQAHPKRPSDKTITHSAQGRSQPTAMMQPTLQASACRSATKAICAVPASRRMRAAFLNCWGSCTPLAYFFLRLKKSRAPHAVGTGVADASQATNDAVGPNALDKQRLSATERLFPISHSSLMGGRIRTNKSQIG